MQVQARWAVAAVAAAVLGGAAWLSTRVYRADEGVSAAPTAGGTLSLMGAGAEQAAARAAQAAPGPAAPRTPAQVRERLFKQGSFQGTEPDGDCVVDAQGRLQPDLALRRRFEYYLLAQGEVTLAEIRSLIAEDACAGRSPDVVAEMLAVFDKYWQLRTYTPRHAFNTNERSTWMPAFEEQKAVRRQMLGPQWADAFFRDDEAYFLNFIDQVDGKAPTQAEQYGPVPQMGPGKDPAAVFEERKKRYGEDAARRLSRADDDWAAWEKRFAGAQAEWERIGNAAELSPPQRKAAMDRYVAEHFKSDEEQRRVRALLNLP